MTIFTIDYCLSDVTDLIVNNTRPGIIHIVRLATGENKTSDNVDIRQLGNALERTIHRALAYISDTHMMHSTRSTANIIDEIRIKAPDVVHINNVHKDYINLPFLAHALIKMQIPTVITLSPNFPEYHTLPSLIKRKRFNRELFKNMFDIWDMLFFVAPNADVAKTASDGIMEGHPIHTIDTHNLERKQAADLYIELFNNVGLI